MHPTDTLLMATMSWDNRTSNTKLYLIFIYEYLRARSPFTKYVKKFEKDPPGQHETTRTPIAS